MSFLATKGPTLSSAKEIAVIIGTRGKTSTLDIRSMRMSAEVSRIAR